MFPAGKSAAGLRHYPLSTLAQSHHSVHHRPIARSQPAESQALPRSRSAICYLKNFAIGCYLMIQPRLEASFLQPSGVDSVDATGHHCQHNSYAILHNLYKPGTPVLGT